MELRATEERDLASLRRLFEDRFGHPLERAAWEWKYRQLPGEGRSCVAIAPDGEVVAHAGALRLPARWRAGEGGIWQLTDFVGSPSRGGLRPPLVELGRFLLDDLPREAEAPWIFGFPSERHFRLGQRVFGYAPLRRIAVWEGDLARAAEPSSGIELEHSDQASAGAEELCSLPPGLGVTRSRAFLNWRYWARPGRYYRFYHLRSPGGRALLVFAFVGTEARAAEVWFSAGLDPRAILAAVAADLITSGLVSWSFWLVPPLTPEALTRSGLEPRGEVFAGYRGRRGRPDPLAEARGFPYQAGDYDAL